MRTQRWSFIVLIIFLLVIISCNKKSSDSNYGVSISAPKMLNSPSVELNEDNLNTLKAANNINFKLLSNILSNSDSCFSFSISSLNFLQYISQINADPKFLSSFNESFDIISEEKLMKDVADVYGLIKSIDSTIKIDGYIETNNLRKKQQIYQSISFPIIEENILKPKKIDFITLNNTKKNIEFYSIKRNIGVFNSTNFLAIDMPIGNENYSLMLIQPKEEFISFCKSFAENQYRTILDNINEQISTIVFPNISGKSNFNLRLPNFSLDTSLNLGTILIESKIEIIKPTRAELKIKNSNIKDKLETSGKTEKFLFNKPFIFILRSRISNGILLSGAFLGC